MERRRNKTRRAADEAIRSANKQIDKPLLVAGSTVKVFINVTMLLSDVWLMGNASFRSCGRIVDKKGNQSTGNEVTGPMGVCLPQLPTPSMHERRI
jgi:hypothetical protein